MWIKRVFFFFVNEFWGCVGLRFEEYCWLVWFCVMFVKGKCWVFKENDVKILSKPLFLFGYRLSYNHPNEVIQIGKEP